MARVDEDRGLLPSVLDRLIDREPGVSTEPQARRSGRLDDLKDAVRRDLQWLLNSRRTIAEIPPGLRQLPGSLLAYGLPDFTHASLANSDDRRNLLRLIEEAIRRFEPRLRDVVVSAIERRPADRGLRFRIDAVLDVEPTPEAVAFDSLLQLPTRAFVMEGDRE